ncbi:MAG: cob(I)yrinic acid a,c-diamide adenosyltransferase [Phocaeicola sp.]|nr:cob(I)yrinic acid a,c-diamide adenosyltransferase [Phocaeicola sp.]MDD7449360.1 cob(I)yrinic acid a,c-diamide adenosyltransferase [Prevotellaceae bacterium]MDY5938571.1 cob(I)yrinic acid a,c-diamide adenosyltransferase [Phocaeicola sp.]
MKRIYTKTGDNATTGIFGGERVSKDCNRIEAVGTIDELNSMIGIIRSFIPDIDERQQRLFQIQAELMSVMSLVGTPSAIREQNPNKIDETLPEQCEMWMDEMMSQLVDNGYFLLPGGNVVSAHLQYARTLARRAERRLCTLHREDPVPSSILKLINRLSDLFFVMARFELQLSDKGEEKWKKFAYKQKKVNKNNE